MLEVLEEILVEFDGTLIVVSHDRAFMDNVVTSTLVFEDTGGVIDYPGGFSDWAARGRALRVADAPGAEATAPEPEQPTVAAAKTAPKKRLSYKLQRELEQLPGQIEALEQQLAELQEQTTEPGLLPASLRRNRASAQSIGRNPNALRHSNRAMD
jgi:ATP-binding cassette subfamily F protein uup